MGTDDHTDVGLAELHAMADRIGLKRAWFQNKPRHPHDDLRRSKRALAIHHGAQDVDSFALVRHITRDVCSIYRITPSPGRN